MKNIAITGADGFVGKVLSSTLSSRGFNVFSLGRKEGDICNPEYFKAISDVGVEHIFHLAGKWFIPESWVNPSEYYRVNVLGAQNVLEFCRHSNAAMTFLSSTSIYGNNLDLPVSENHHVDPNNPYAHSKLLAEDLCKFYSKNFNVKSQIIRAFNIYGPGQKENALIPLIIKQIRRQEVIKVQSLSPRRDMVYVQDLVEALVLCLKCELDFAVMNIGSGYSLSVKEIIEFVQSAFHTNYAVESTEAYRKNEIMDIYANIDLSRKLLGWTPKTTFYDGICKMIENDE